MPNDDAARRAAFERFSQSRIDRAYRLARLILRNPFEAEDVVHDAALQAWLHWTSLRDPERLDAWFDGILLNECRMRMRHRRGTRMVVDPADEPAREAFSGLEERERIYRALAELDANHRIAVVLRYVFDWSTAEIAARTGQREGTVKSRLHYALRELRALLEAGERMPGGSR